MFEHKERPLLPRAEFAWRLARSAAFGLLLVFASLAFGMIGYRYFEQMSWIDAFANAAMILSGMGPFAPMNTNAGKLFAGCYAIYCGLAILVITGITFGPVVHRFLHKFHLDESDENQNTSS